tara:strand:+ start:1252 stop:1776 length:525 start_codon:yes stop_codon:yes gene_type:complete
MINSYLMFESDRLWIRPTTEEDAHLILEVFNSPGALTFIGDRNIHSINDAIKFIQDRTLKQLNTLGFSNFTLIEKLTGTKVGVAGLFKRPSMATVDLGYALLPEFEKRGFAREASRCLLKVAKDKFLLTRLSAITHPKNQSSKRLLVDLGFKFKDQRVVEGIQGTSDYYEITLE